MENVTGREKVAFVEEGTPAESELRMFTGNQKHVGLLQEPGSGGVEGGGGGCGTLLVSHEFDATAAISRCENRKQMNSRISEDKEVSSFRSASA